MKPLEAKEGFTFGCDPEGFVFKGKTPVPACEFIPGTKAKPHPVEYGAVQVDGMAAEFNIDPVDNYKDWEHHITAVIKQLKSFLPSGYTLKFVPSVTFDPNVFDAAPNFYKELGCQPDYDVYSGNANPPPTPENPYVRCAGGHLHVGWTKGEDLCDIQHILNCQDLGKQFDWFLGGWSVNKDKDVVRRALYGKMGACRYKDYGLEYRVLSNFWVVNKELRFEIWNRMNHAINAMSNLFLPDRLNVLTEQLRNCINSSQTDEELFSACVYPLMTLNKSLRRF